MMYKKPDAVSWPNWKFLLLVLFSQALFTFLVWLCSQPWRPRASLTVNDILLGSGLPLLALWQRWIWKSFRGKRLRLLIWIGHIFASFYFSGLPLAAAIGTFSFLLERPWSWFVNGTLVVVSGGMWLLPLFSLKAAERLEKFQWEISGYALGLAGIAGVLGAAIGMFSARHGHGNEALLTGGILFSLVAIGLAQHTGYEIWTNRPWSKGNGNAKS